MDILRETTVIKQFKMRELEEIWLEICFDANMYSGNNDFDFRMDFLDKLSFPQDPPFERIRRVGLTSSTFTDLVMATNVGFYKRLIDTISDSIFYLHDRMNEVSVRDLELIYGVGPKTARKFHHRVRQRDDPIVQQTAVLFKYRLNWMRDRGYYIPPRLDLKTYRQYEQTYLFLTKGSLTY